MHEATQAARRGAERDLVLCLERDAPSEAWAPGHAVAAAGAGEGEFLGAKGRARERLALALGQADSGP